MKIVTIGKTPKQKIVDSLRGLLATIENDEISYTCGVIILQSPIDGSVSLSFPGESMKWTQAMGLCAYGQVYCYEKANEQ